MKVELPDYDKRLPFTAWIKTLSKDELSLLNLYSAGRGFEAARQTPVDMLLFCPRCRAQHIDKVEPERGWLNPSHRSHLCGGCGCIWRPCDQPTNGVSHSQIMTRGKDDWLLDMLR